MGAEDDIARRRQINNLRFLWHEKVIADPEVGKRPTSLRVASHIMHRFHPDLGYAEVSFAELARKFNMPVTSAKRAVRFLLERGWLIVREPWKAGAGRRANRYAFGNGPDGLSLEDHAPGIYDDTV